MPLPRLPALRQIAQDHDRLDRFIRGEIRRRRPNDDPFLVEEMVAHAWEQLTRICNAHPRRMTSSTLRARTLYSVRKGIRNHRAFLCQLSVNAYGKYVSLRQVEGHLREGGWRGSPADFATIFNQTGTPAEVRRRRLQGRTISSNDAFGLYGWIHQRHVDFDPAQLVDTHTSHEETLLHLTCVSALSRLALGGNSGVATLCRAYISELERSRTRLESPRELTVVANECGLTGGSRDRALSLVRGYLRTELTSAGM